MPYPDAVLPRERARALSFNAYTSRPDHWGMSIFMARTVNDTYIEQARASDGSVLRSEEFTLTPELVADLEAQARLRASLSGPVVTGQLQTCRSDGEVKDTEKGDGKVEDEEEAFNRIKAWRYDPREHAVLSEEPERMEGTQAN